MIDPTCPRCGRPDLFTGDDFDDGRGAGCYLTHAPHHADVKADCDRAIERGTAKIYAEAERRKREFLREALA